MAEDKRSIYDEPENIAVERQIGVLKDILSAKEEEIRSYDWMRKMIVTYGIFPYHRSLAENSYSDILFSERGLLQTVDEFTRFCVYIAGLNIKRAIEIGVYRGRSSYFICALLSRRNSDMRYEMVDIRDRLDNFDKYKELLPALCLNIPSTSDDFAGQSFDFVFIDGNHSYDGSWHDWENVGRCSNGVVIFHDIYGHEYDDKNGGIVKTWLDVKKETGDKKHRVFSTFPEEWMGIGTVWMGGGDNNSRKKAGKT